LAVQKSDSKNIFIFMLNVKVIKISQGHQDTSRSSRYVKVIKIRQGHQDMSRSSRYVMFY